MPCGKSERVALCGPWCKLGNIDFFVPVNILSTASSNIDGPLALVCVFMYMFWLIKVHNYCF